MGKNYSSRDIRRFRQTDNYLFDAYMRYKQKKENYVPKEGPCTSDYEEGIKWFLEGKSLEEATTKLKNSESFCFGYASESRRYHAAQYMYELGYNCFLEGKSLDSLASIYRDKEPTIQGYNDAKAESMNPIEGKKHNR